MFGYELKRIVRSKIFIILIVLSLVYFGYITINYIYYGNENIKDSKESAAQSNAYIDELVSDSEIGDEMFAALKEKSLELMDRSIEFNRLHYTGDEDMTYDESGNEIHHMSDDEIALHSEFDRVSTALDILDYQFNEYPKLINTTLIKAIMLVNDDSQDIYTIRLNKKAIDKYNIVKDFSLIDRKPASIWHTMYKMYYEYFYIFLTIVFVILASDVFCYEKTRKLEGMVYTSKMGRGEMFTAKLLSLLSIAFAIMIVFTAADISLAHYIMGGRLLNEPLQVMNTYQTSTANITILDFILYCNALRFSVLVFAIGLAAAVSQVSRNVFASIVVDCIIMFGMFALYMYSVRYEQFDIETGASTFSSERYALYEKLRVFLPSCFTNPMAYFEKFDYINVANYPFTRMTTCLAVTVAAAIVFILFAYFRFGNVLKFLPRRAKAKE